MGIVPLGTGNDLSRVLGWGSEHSTSDITGEQILRNIQRATPVKLDRYWELRYAQAVPTFKSENFKTYQALLLLTIILLLGEVLTILPGGR